MATSRVPHDLSQFDRDLIHHLEAHVESEKEVIRLYDTLSYDEHPYVAFLAQMIREDEARHHRLFLEWIETITSMAELRDTSDGIPHIDRQSVSPDTIHMVKRLIAFEEEDLEVTRKLRHEIRGVRTSTLWGVLAEVLIADTKKHITMLRFLLDRLNERQSSDA